MPGLPSDDQVDAYINQVANALGISPTVAIDVSHHERQSRSTGWVGDNGSSFGPFMLHLGGLASGGNAGKGLGDVFKERTGLDPRDIANTWQQQIVFALTWARDVSGWEPFHGAQAAGYGVWDGIKNAAGKATATLTYYFPIAGYTANPRNTYHTPGATDLFAPLGTAIRDVADGRVETVSSSGPGGNALIIKGLDGLDYYYAHLQEAPLVHPGDYVAAGQVIGKVGQTGNAASTEPHLHLGIGYGINAGTGAAGGTGRNFDAQTFLANILANGGASETTRGVVAGVGGAAVNANPAGDIKSGLAGAWQGGVQGIQNYLGDRAASITLLTLGIVLILAGIWGFAMGNPTIRMAAKTVVGSVAGPAGQVVAAAA